MYSVEEIILTDSKKTGVTWDYTEHARHYDSRVDYLHSAIDALLDVMRLSPDSRVADIGAGTGKLTKLLLARGLDVCAVEPNDAMRSFGVSNTKGGRATWSKGTAEETGLPASSFGAATFGSSFNVTDRGRALAEVARILAPRGWFACMWNHRDLDDPIQKRVERVIIERLPSYQYGSRREDQTEVIGASGLFEPAIFIERIGTASVSREAFVDGWRSHATLRRQAGEHFADIVAAIERDLGAASEISVRYSTRIWCARRLP